MELILLGYENCIKSSRYQLTSQTNLSCYFDFPCFHCPVADVRFPAYLNHMPNCILPETYGVRTSLYSLSSIIWILTLFFYYNFLNQLTKRIKFSQYFFF